MKKLIATAAIISTAIAMAPDARADGEWGCTVFLCLASPTNPMAIKDCATALLKIRPWKSPSCPAAKVTNISVIGETSLCPPDYEFFPEDFEREIRDDEFGRPRLVPGGMCIGPNGDIEPSGEYRHSVMTYRDHDGIDRVYRIAY